MEKDRKRETVYKKKERKCITEINTHSETGRKKEKKREIERVRSRKGKGEKIKK